MDRTIYKKSKDIEMNQLNKLKENNKIDNNAYEDYSRIIKALSVRHKRAPSFRLLFANIGVKKKDLQGNLNNIRESNSDYETIKKIFIENHLLIIDMLKGLETEENKEFIQAKILDEEKLINYLKVNKLPNNYDLQIANEFNSIVQQAFNYEREVIQHMYETRMIDHETTVTLKQNIILMENYYINNNSENIVDHLINISSRRKAIKKT